MQKDSLIRHLCDPLAFFLHTSWIHADFVIPHWTNSNQWQCFFSQQNGASFQQFNRPPPNFPPAGSSGAAGRETALQGNMPPGKPMWNVGDQALAKYWEVRDTFILYIFRKICIVYYIIQIDFKAFYHDFDATLPFLGFSLAFLIFLFKSSFFPPVVSEGGRGQDLFPRWGIITRNKYIQRRK